MLYALGSDHADWYHDAVRTLDRFVVPGDALLFCGFIAATSPLQLMRQNVHMAYRAYRQHRRREVFRGFLYSHTLNLRRAAAELFSVAQQHQLLVTLVGLDKRAFERPPTDSCYKQLRSADSNSPNTLDQSPSNFCRNSRIVGYQGLSVRSKSQRQSGTKGKATHTGTPSAPAR